MAMVGSLQIVTQSSPPTITVTNVLLQFKIVHLHAVLVIRLNYGIVILLYYCSGTSSSQIKGKKSLTLLLLCLSKVGFYTSLPVDYEGMLYLGSKSWLWSKSNFLPRSNYWLWCVLACNNFAILKKNSTGSKFNSMTRPWMKSNGSRLLFHHFQFGWFTKWV